MWDTTDFVAFLLAAPVFGMAAGWLGLKAMHWYWGTHRPYRERVDEIKYRL